MSDIKLHVAAKIMVMAIVLSVMLLFAAIGLLILIQFCIFGRAFRRGEFVNSAILERGGQGVTNMVNTSMSKDDLEKLPCYDYVVKDNNMESKSPVDCAVCLENFMSGDKCRLLPKCKHSFHAQCVDVWLLKTPFCPICRTTTAGGSCSVNVGDSSHFSDASFHSGWSRSTAESSIDIRESQRIEENSHMHNTLVTNLGTCMNTKSSHSSSTCSGIELTENQIKIVASTTIHSNSTAD